MSSTSRAAPALLLLCSSLLWCVLSCGLRARQPLAQPVSLINPPEEEPEDALPAAGRLPSYFLTHWHARSVEESWGRWKPQSQWQVDRCYFKSTSGSRGTCGGRAAKNMKGTSSVQTEQVGGWKYRYVCVVMWVSNTCVCDLYITMFLH